MDLSFSIEPYFMSCRESNTHSLLRKVSGAKRENCGLQELVNKAWRLTDRTI